MSGPAGSGPAGSRRLRPARADAGNAVVELVLVAVVVLMPLVYLLLTLFELQRSVFAVTEAAREAGRALVTAADLASGEDRATYAAGLALDDQGLPSGTGDFAVSFVPVGAACAGAGRAQSLTPGQDFVACVRRTVVLPGVPSLLAGSRNTVTGRFVVHVNDYAAARG